MYGATGNDILLGAGGNDILTGISGKDIFKFVSTSDGNDTITDFTLGNPSSVPNADVIDISDLLAASSISPATFLASPGTYLQVTSATNTVISFDADGAGGGAAVPLVTLQSVNTTLNDLMNNEQIKVS